MSTDPCADAGRLRRACPYAPSGDGAGLMSRPDRLDQTPPLAPQAVLVPDEDQSGPGDDPGVESLAIEDRPDQRDERQAQKIHRQHDRRVGVLKRGRAGRSRTKLSTPSRTKATTSSTTSVTATNTSAPC